MPSTRITGACLASALAVALAGSASASPYTADFTGPGLDPTLRFSAVRFRDSSVDPTYRVGGGKLTLRDSSGGPGEANIFSKFAVAGDFRAKITADTSKLNGAGLLFSAYDSVRGNGGFSGITFPGGNIYTNGAANVSSIFNDITHFSNEVSGPGHGGTVTLEIDRVGTALAVYDNGILVNRTADLLLTHPVGFLISLCQGSCYPALPQGASASVSVSSFTIAQPSSRVVEPAALTIFGPALAMVAMVRRRIAPSGCAAAPRALYPFVPGTSGP